MEQRPEPLQMPIIGSNKISYNLNRLKCFLRCLDIFSIIMNFAVWIFLILIIITSKRKKELKGSYLKNDSEYENDSENLYLFLGFGAFSYLFYFITGMNSSIFKYLKINDKGIIKEKIGDIYKTILSISLVGESYHYEGRDGNIS